MSRSIILAFLAIAMLAAPSAQAQATGGVTLNDVPTGTLATNATFLEEHFDVSMTATNVQCPTGGSATVELAAVVAGGDGIVKAEITPSSISFNLGQSVGAGIAGNRGGSLEVSVLVSTGGVLVSKLTNATIAITATPTYNGCAPMSSPPATAATGSFSVAFKPDLANRLANAATQTGEAVPGLELPLVALGLVGVALLRRKA